MSVYFLLLRVMRTTTSRRHTVQSRKHTKSKKSIQIVAGDFNADLGPGIGVERVSVGPHTLKESNRRGEIG